MKEIKHIEQLTTTLLADYILFNYGPMSHLKLQKLLYYCEGYHLAYFEKSIIETEFEAWVHGPVSPIIYHEFKGSSILYSDIAFEGDYNPNEIVEETITSDQLGLLSDVLQELSKWTGFQLENSTHQEFPWLEARKGYSPGEICDVNISKESMMNYYKKDLND